jgi:hypothetical protein
MSDVEDFEERWIVATFPRASVTYTALATETRHSNVAVYVYTNGDPQHYGSTVNVYANNKAGRALLDSFTLTSTPTLAAASQVFNATGAADGFSVDIIPAGNPTLPTSITAIAYGYELSSTGGGGGGFAVTGTGYPYFVNGSPDAAAQNEATWTATLGLVNGDNEDVQIGFWIAGLNIAVVSGAPTAPFAIDGIQLPFVGQGLTNNGLQLRLVSFGVTNGGSGQQMTIRNQSVTETTAAARIITGTGADAVYGAPPAGGLTTVDLAYNGTLNRWILFT